MIKSKPTLSSMQEEGWERTQSHKPFCSKLLHLIKEQPTSRAEKVALVIEAEKEKITHRAGQ